MRVQLEGALEEHACLGVPFHRAFPEAFTSTQPAFIRFETDQRLAACQSQSGLIGPEGQRGRHPRDDFVLNRENLISVAVEAVSPDLPGPLCELYGNTNPVLQPPHATVQYEER